MSDDKKMTAGKRAAQLGAVNERQITELARLYGCSASNLIAKFKSNPKQFDIIVLGCLEYRRLEEAKRELEKQESEKQVSDFKIASLL